MCIRDRYQTVYSKVLGSAAAPTAGLHFTPELLEKIRAKGVKIGYVTLHVGLGTFRPVKEDTIEDHPMHSEYCTIPQETADLINETRANGGRCICVGTTSCRTLESWAAEDGHMEAKSGWTNIYIYPGYRFKVMDGLVTNFHLPESTLIMLVSAFAGREHVLAAYEEAVREKDVYKRQGLLVEEETDSTEKDLLWTDGPYIFALHGKGLSAEELLEIARNVTW